MTSLLANDAIQQFLVDDNVRECCLGSAYEIEQALELIADTNKKIEFLKGLKQHKAHVIDQEIGDLEHKNDRLRQIILSTMKTHEPDQKTLNFPDVGKVSRRMSKTSWKIEDQDAVIAFFEKEGKKDDVVKVKETVDARAAKSLVEEYADSGVTVPGVSVVPGEESISITFERASDKPVAKKKKTETEPEAKSAVRKRLPKKADQTLDELDELDDLVV